MAAVVQIHEITNTNTGVDKTTDTVRFKSADNTTVDTNDRIQIPVAGSDYSYTKQLKVYVSSAPSVDIDNIQAYSDGTNGMGTGISVEYDLHTTFVTQIDTTIAGTDLFTITSGNAINMDAINTGPHATTETGYVGDVLRLQMAVASTAGAGAVSAEALTVSYDES
ncbi:MAG: hypothetical protein GQ540_03585 [Lutibacter sp.]|uniref:hypothetical protein n=1 Tax=Lutibacter sp. TaxID=1925666 RepID=UPI001A00A05E|nr:hypothetical protein [Lutibacter sp.]NOR27594.1 hypothetical protein [Lutibacter sp.]